MRKITERKQELRAAKRKLMELENAFAEERKGILERILQHEEMRRELTLQKDIVASLEKILNRETKSDDLNKQAEEQTRVEAPDTSISLTELCRWVLSASNKPLRPTEVRDEIEKLGYPLNYKNTMATLGIVLNRLQGAGEIQEVTNDGKKHFIWNKTANVRVRRYRAKTNK